MRAGRLRRILNLQTATRVRTPTGGFTDTWATVATVRGGIEALRGTERFTAGQMEQQIEFRIVLRVGPAWEAIDDSWRIVDATTGSAYDIVSVLPHETRSRPGRMIEIMAKRGTQEAPA